MTLDDQRQALHDAAAVLLDDKRQLGEYGGASRTLFAVLNRLASFRDEEHPWRWGDGGRTYTEKGEVVSPEEAALCSTEPLRNARFLQGVRAAVHQAMERFPQEPVRLLYAGTGPFGTLVLPLLHLFAPERLQVLFLDYHQASLDTLRALVRTLELEPYVIDYLQADAATYRVPEEAPFHVMVSETMKAGLYREMQVPIMLNLVPQLAPGGSFVPREIRIDARAAKHQRVPKPGLKQCCFIGKSEEMTPIGPVFSIGQENAGMLAASLDREGTLPAETLPFPDGTSRVALFTEIILFPGIELAYGQCSLTMAAPMPLCEQPESSRKVEFLYKLGEEPGVDIRSEVAIEPSPKKQEVAKLSPRERETVRSMIGFIREIGIPVWNEPIEEETFLPGILVKNGGLAVDEEKLLYPGDLLHEAGHLATLTAEKRGRVYNDVSKKPGDEIATLAWSYAAAVHLRIDPDVVFHGNGYKGEAPALVDHYTKGGDMGVPLLQWYGLTRSAHQAGENGEPPFPAMSRWLREE